MSGGAIRSYYLAKALVNKGHRVVMITSSHGGVGRVENVEGIEVHYLPIAYNNRFGFYARTWAFISFVVLSAKRTYRFRDFDVCYAISVPLTVGLIARWLKFRHGLKFIFEVGDLWPDAPIQLDFVRNRYFQRLLFRLEKSIYRSAEAIVALSPSIQLSIKEKVPGNTVHLIPNMADCDFFVPDVKEPALEKKFGTSGKFVVSYVGAFGLANGLNHLLSCANETQKTGLAIHFIICGDGAMREALYEQARKLELQNLSFIDSVNRDGVKEILNVTDAVFVSYKNVPILETGSPNKYFDGLAAGKLIVINFGGWIRQELEENATGIFVDPLLPSDFVKKILPFISDPNLLKRFQLAARTLAEKRYSRRILGETFTQLFS